MGHQLLGLATDAQTTKLKYGKQKYFNVRRLSASFSHELSDFGTIYHG